MGSGSFVFCSHTDKPLPCTRWGRNFYDAPSLLIPYSRGDLSSYLCEKAEVSVMDYRENGTYFEVCLKQADYQRLKEYEV